MPTNARLASATNVFGGGTMPARVRRAKRWKKNPLLDVCGKMEVTPGYTAGRTTHIAEIGSGNVNTLAENSTTINATALPTLTTVASTLISIYVYVAKTSESDLAQTPEHASRLDALIEMLVMEALGDYIAHGATNGIAPLIASLTAVGTSGADLNTVTIRAAVRSLSLAGGHEERFALVTDAIGFEQIKNDIESAGGVLQSTGLAPQISRLLGDGAPRDAMGFTGFSYDQVDFWLVNGSGVSQLYNDGTDTYDILIAYPSDDDSLEAPENALTLAGRAMPSTRPDATLAGTIGDLIGVAHWMAPLIEDAVGDIYKATFDCWISNTNRARAIRRAQA